MTVDEVFEALASRMITGMMVHEQLMNSFRLLGLEGYAKCHEYHYISETKGYIRLTNYKVEHFGSLIKQGPVPIPDVIPDSWFGFNRDEVDRGTRQQAIAAAFDEWIIWETGSKELYSVAFDELMSQSEIAAAEFIKEYILDVEEELVYAKTEKIHKASMDYDMTSIVEEQKQSVKFFEKKIHES